MAELRDYQKRIVCEEQARKNLLVVAPMGAGKTLATLTYLASLVYSTSVASDTVGRESVKNILIIAPKRVATSVWAQEVEKYDMGLNIRFCEKAVDIKLFLFEPAPHRVCVCSVTRIKEIPHGCWDVVVLDESTLYGNKTAQRSKEVRRICNKVPRRVLLSGTPAHRGYEKLWHQIFLLDGGASLGKSLTAFREKYMQIKYQASGAYIVWDMRKDMIPVLLQDIQHLIYIVKDAVDLPPCFYKNIYIDLPSKRQAEYIEFERSSIISFAEENKTGSPYTSEKTLVAFASSSRGIKLRQLASGCVYADETNKTYSVTHKEKIEALKEIVEVAESGVLVAYAFKSEYEELKKAFPKARQLETAKDIEDWNKGKIDVALVHPASVGHGLNLQFGGCVAVWFSLTYDAELYAQLNKRLHRSGQKDPVSIIHLIARGTIDEKVLKVLQQREKDAQKFENL